MPDKIEYCEDCGEHLFIGHKCPDGNESAKLTGSVHCGYLVEYGESNKPKYFRNRENAEDEAFYKKAYGRVRVVSIFK